MATRFDPKQRFSSVVPDISYWKRLSRVLTEDAGRSLRRFIGRFPGLGFIAPNRRIPRLQTFHSDSAALANWYLRDFGSREKPESLSEIPWDYIEREQENIPFMGLREYWYPALMSHELGADKPEAVKLLGDDIVLFRDADGKPLALENRCPHRGPLLSLGQVNVWDLGTITCRYHGMTFDGSGACVAFLSDGPDSPACGKIRAKSYRAVEAGDIIFVYMGDKENPPALFDTISVLRHALADGEYVRERKRVPYSHLNLLDNTVDLTHVGCLHRTCSLFGDQKMGGGVDYSELEDGAGIHAYLHDSGGHAGGAAIDEIRWFFPNLVFHGREMMGGALNGLIFWFVPEDVGHFNAWLIGSVDRSRASWSKAKFIAYNLKKSLQSDAIPSMACFYGGDAAIQMAQGRVARWDLDKLARTDRAVVKVRQMIKKAHRAEIADREARGLPGLKHRITTKPTAPAAMGE